MMSGKVGHGNIYLQATMMAANDLSHHDGGQRSISP